MTGQVSLPDLIQDAPVSKWVIAKVESVQVSEHAVTLAYHGGSIPHVAYLESYTPAVNDVVHCLTDERNGFIVLGKEVLRAATVPPTPAAPFTVAPNGSSTYFQNPPPPHWSGSQVRQGPGESGAFFYAANAFAGTGIEMSMVEIQLVPFPAGSMPTLSLVLHRNANTSAPFEAVSQVYFHEIMPWMSDWHKIPVGWAADLNSGAALGIGLASDIYSAVITSGGTLRFTPL